MECRWLAGSPKGATKPGIFPPTIPFGALWGTVSSLGRRKTSPRYNPRAPFSFNFINKKVHYSISADRILTWSTTNQTIWETKSYFSVHFLPINLISFSHLLVCFLATTLQYLSFHIEDFFRDVRITKSVCTRNLIS